VIIRCTTGFNIKRFCDLTTKFMCFFACYRCPFSVYNSNTVQIDVLQRLFQKCKAVSTFL
jgi:hypothetical protein